MHSTLKRHGNGRFNVESTWCVCRVFIQSDLEKERYFVGAGNLPRMEPSLNSLYFTLPLLFCQKVCTLPTLKLLIKANLKKNSFWQFKVVFKNDFKQKQLFKNQEGFTRKPKQMIMNKHSHKK